jgi:hypothetical protein
MASGTALGTDTTKTRKFEKKWEKGMAGTTGLEPDNDRTGS